VGWRRHFPFRGRRCCSSPFTISADQGKHCANRNGFTYLHDEALDDSAFEHFYFNRGFFSINYGDNISTFDCIAWFDPPLNQSAYLHVSAE